MSKPNNNLCTRSVEFRAISEDSEEAGDGRTLEGYAAVFNQSTDINSWEGRFSEDISPGAFAKTLSERKPIMQFDHGHDSRVGNVPIGVYTELREDDNGLFVRGRMFDNPVVEPVRQAIEAGAVSGMSFKFKVNRDEWRDAQGNLVRPEELGRLLYEPGDRGPLQRTIKEIQLFEAGPVVTPAYEQTSVGVRSLSDEEREALVADYARTMVHVAGEHGPELDASEDRAQTTAPAQGGDAVPIKKTQAPAKKTAKPKGHPMPDGNCTTCGY